MQIVFLLADSYNQTTLQNTSNTILRDWRNPSNNISSRYDKL